MRIRLFFLCGILTACQPIHDANVGISTTLQSPTGEQVYIQAEIARSVEERGLGLMHRTALAEDTGMLFIFEHEQPLAFWMKNTLIPLDIIFFATDGTFISAASMVPCTVDPCKTYPSNAPALYALEVPVGTVQKYGIQKGWRLLLPVEVQ